MLKRVNLRNNLGIIFFIAFFTLGNVYTFSENVIPEIAIHSSTTDFSANEDIVFSLEASSDVINDIVLPPTIDIIDDGSTITSPTMIENNTTVQANITNSSGDVFNIVELYSDMIHIGEATATQNAIVLIDNNNMPAPGEYTLNFTVGDTTVTQDFTWGVLALNTNKDFYTPGENVDIAMSVLDSVGNMVCDSSLTLRVQHPSGEVTEFTTHNGSIITNVECNYTEYLLKDDYEASFVVTEIGQYSLELYAQTPTGAHTIYDFFEVKETLDFEIERHAPTRIYPPQEYPVIIEIKANKDFSGTISEYVPESFKVLNSEEKYLNTDTLEKVNELSNNFYSTNIKYGTSYRLNDQFNIINWNVDFKKGNTYKLAYSFDADDVSPEFYTIEPIRLNGISFGGPWNIAGDQVTASPDTSVYAAVNNIEHQGTGRNIVHVSDSIAYIIYTDSDGVVGYTKTTNGGLTWGTQVNLTALTNCRNVAVWYDGWTPGSTGSIIHVAFLDQFSSDIYYENIDTANSDTQKGEVVAVDRSTTGHSATTDTLSIAVATDSDIYIAASSSVASSVAEVRYSQNTGTSWSTTTDEGMDNVVKDYVMLTPLSSGDIMLFRWDVSADDIQSKEYEDGSDTWDGSWTNIDTNAIDDPNAAAANPHTQTWASTFNTDTFDVYLAYVNNAGGASADLKTASYNGSSWTATTSLLTAQNSLEGTAIGINKNTKEIYVTYLRGTVNAANNAYYKVSSDFMSTWSVERGPLTLSADDHKAINTDIIFTDKLGVFIFDDDEDDLFYGTVVDDGAIPSSSIFSSAYGFEMGSLLGATTSGSVSIDSTNFRSGAYSLRSNPTSSTSYAQYPTAVAATGAASATDVDNLSMSFAFRVGTLPGANAAFVFSNETTERIKLILNTSGTISIGNSSVTPLVTTSYAVSTNTWYNISLSYNSDTDLAEVGVYDNEMEVRHDYITSTITGAEDLDNIRLGIQTSTTANVYFDDVFIYTNNEATNFPLVLTDYAINRMDLDSTGTDTAWTGDYTSIDEIPPNSADYVETNAIADETSGLESSSAAGIDGTILNVAFTNTIWESVSQTSSVRAVRTRSSGAIETTAVDPGTAVTVYSRFNSYNTGSSDALWTTSSLDSLEVGVGNDTAVTNNVRSGSNIVEVGFVEDISVTGNVYNAGTSTALTECDSDTSTYELRLYTKGNYYWASCSNSDGSFTFSNVERPDTGDTLILWIDNEFAPETDGALVVRYDGTGDSISNVLYDDTVTITSDDTNPVTNTMMDVFDGNSDSDIPYTVTSSNLTVNSGFELLVKIKSGVANGSTVYDPGGTITTNSTGGDFHVDDNSTAYIDSATSSIGRDIEVDEGAALNIDGSTNVLGGDILTSTTGHVTYSTGTPTVTLSGAGTIGGGSTALTFYNFSISSTGTSTVSTNINVNNNLVLGDGSNSHTLDVETNDKNIDVNGNVTIAASATLSASSTASFNIGGDFTDSGTFTSNSSTITFDKGSGTATINQGSGAFYNIVFNDNAGSATYLLADNLNVDNDLTITGGSLDVDNTSNYTIYMGGDWVNNDTFLERSGTVIFDGTNNSDIDSGCATVSSCTAENFYNVTVDKTDITDLVSLINDHLRVSNLLTITRGILVQGTRNIRAEGTSAVSIAANGTWSNISTGDVTLGGTLVNNGILTFKSNDSCGGTNEIVIDAVSGTPAWSGSGSFELRDVNMSNQDADVAINVFSSDNTTGNTGLWTFNSGCTGGGSLTTDIVDSGGTPVASPSVSLGNVPFTFNFQTSTGTLGVSSQKIRVSNTTGTSPWTLSIAASGGSTSFWDGTSSDYDFNDPTGSAGDGADSDSLGGQMTIDPSIGSITPDAGCSTTGLTLGSSSSFNEPGAINSITITTASGSAEVDCFWDITGVSISQSIPEEQPSINYDIDMIVSVIAS